MLFMPLNVLIMWLVGLLSISILGGGIYILYEWYEGELVGMSYLLGGLAMVLWSFGGRFLSLPLFRRRGSDEPKRICSGTVKRVPRPDGTVLQVEFYGPEDGQPIILSHGWGPNSNVWYYAKRQLSDRFRVIVWDLPGLGKSSKPKNNDYSLEKYARDLEAVVDLAGDKPVILLGHSMGGMLTLTFCRLFPEHLGRRVAGLILVDSTYTNPVRTSIFSKFLRTVQKPLLEPLLYLTIGLSPLFWLMTWLSYFNGSLYISVELSGFKGTETRGQLDFSAFLSALGSPGVLARGTLAMFNYDETPMLSKINVPVLLVVGASDIATRPAASIRMKAELPQSDLVILKPAGHMSLMEQNQQFAEAVEKFSVERLELSRSNHLPLQRNMSTTEIARTANSLVSAYENFGFRLLARLAEQDAHKNVFISPFSVAIALAMTYNGARGETEQAIAETLSLTGLSLQEINAASESLLSMGDNLDPQVKLAVANSIWVRQGITLASDFIQRLRDSYDSEATNLNFGNPEAATVINQWVSDKTQEKIKKLVTPDLISDAILILINAVYFKGTWAKQFDKDRTEERDFILLDGSHKLHPMMSQSGCYAYYESEKFQAVSLPYGEGRVSMYIFLPKQSLPIGEFQALLNVENWQYWIAQFDEREGDIVLPRFKVEYKTKLKDTLGALGMGVAFEKNADFGGIGAGDLVISEVIHKTFIDVNEEGTEAAAATAVMMPRMGGFQSRSRFSMVIDRPFFYAIRDSQTGALLFMGFVLDPG